MNRTLDVLIPHYSDPAGLELSLASIASQTWGGNLRVVVFDDGSPPQDYARACEVCEYFVNTSRFHLRLIRSEENLGRPGARNELLDCSEARYLAWLDAGDIWYPDKLRIQFNYLYHLEYQGANPNVFWVTCDYNWTQDGKTRSLRQDVRGDQYAKLLEGENFRAYLWTLLGTAEAFKIAGGFDKRLSRLQDMDYFLTFIKGGGKIVTPPSSGPLCEYYKSDFGRNAADVEDSYKIIRGKNSASLLKYPPHFLRQLDWKYELLFARFSKANGNYAKYLTHRFKAALLRPKHFLRSIVSAK